MKYKVVGNEYYEINEDREVSRVDGMELDLSTTKESITIPLYGYNKEVDKEWLYWLSFFKLELAVQFRDRVFDYEFKENGSLKHMRVDPMIAVFKEPVYFGTDNEFRLVARFPNYGIRYDGTTVNVKTGLFSIKKKDTINYIKSNIVDQAKLYKSDAHLTHRLVALTWLSNENYLKYPIVDHKDGDKTNCHYKNLEWVSYNGNNKAAVDIGLRTDNYKVKVRNIETNEIKEFHSMTDASKHIGRSRINTVHTPLHFKKVWKGSNGIFEIRKNIDMNPWYFINGRSLTRKQNSFRFTITNIDKTIIEYTDINDLKVNELKTFDLMDHNMIVKEFIAKFPKRQLSIEITEKVKNVGYEARDTKTLKTYYGKTAELLGKTIHLPKSTVIKYGKLGDSFAINDYQIRKFSDAVWTDDYLTKNKNKPNSILVKNKRTNEETCFKSLRSAAEHFNVDKKTISRIIKDNDLFRNKYLISNK